METVDRVGHRPAEAQVKRRDDDHVEYHRGQEPEQDDDGHGRLDFAAGLAAPRASGISARPAASAVIRMGTSRSIAPRNEPPPEVRHAFAFLEVRMCETSMMPLRVAMPNTVMKPMRDATLSTPPLTNTPGDAADEGQRQVEHDQRGIPCGAGTPGAAGSRCR
jgi:hypothetical protein